MTYKKDKKDLEYSGIIRIFDLSKKKKFFNIHRGVEQW